jgi:acetyl/propionyl-CoA carboxylase alpha subunit
VIRRLLIANRGEIARRIARSCARLGVEYVCVYSEADAQSPHLRGAAATACLGPAPVAASYLDQTRIIDAARAHACDAIHPGYGFLAENAAFAAAVAKAGLIFVGPRADTIAALGDKARAKELMLAAGVNTVPGTAKATENLRRLCDAADGIGYPVLLKPTAGGGGKGMQVVHERGAMKEAAERAIRLARANFCDGRLILERYLERARHIEVQIFGDARGNTVHLFERECSLQRRHQKVIEEAPAPKLPHKTRAALLQAAVRGARAVGYTNAGTFEFIVADDGEFHFLEVNTRLQVEHPVTEAITGVDLVEWQLRVASGEALPLAQDEIEVNGHAIECRIYAEDPGDDFRPAPGRVLHLAWPQHLRVEAGIEDKGEVSAFYDPMIGKLIAHAGSRGEALEQMSAGLKSTVVLGLTTNLGFLQQVVSDPKIVRGPVHTAYLDENLARYNAAHDAAAAVACACAAAIETERASMPRWPWSVCHPVGALDRASLAPGATLGSLRFWIGRELYAGRISVWSEGAGIIAVGGEEFSVQVDPGKRGPQSGKIGERHWHAARGRSGIELSVGGTRFALEPYGERNPAQFSIGASALSPMPGIVVALPAAIGQSVRAGDVLAVVEAMKMENRVAAAFDGRVTAINCSLNQSVNAGDLLVTVEPAD